MSFNIMELFAYLGLIFIVVLLSLLLGWLVVLVSTKITQARVKHKNKHTYAKLIHDMQNMMHSHVIQYHSNTQSESEKGAEIDERD